MTLMETAPPRRSAAPVAQPHRSTLYGDDVVFMYPAADPATYLDYGCTFLAWGGGAKGEAVRHLTSIGVHATGSMWCLTAGARTVHENPDLHDAVARDIEGKPIAVWWLFDCTFEGTPTYFGCTNHPAYRAFVRQMVAEQMRGDAPGLHVDDHLGTAHTVAYLGGCFCDTCMTDFRSWLRQHGTVESLMAAGVNHWDGFDYRTLVRQHAAADADYQANRETIPLHPEFLDFQLQAAAENVRQLGALAAEIVKRPITLSANTCLPELPHTVVTPHLTHMVGEVNHHAIKGTAELLDAVHAYRMAEAIGKPLAATAKGQDWAHLKASGQDNLAKVWIALGYCMGQRLMAPHHQWCYTQNLGTHWYDPDSSELAPMYRFVRAHSQLFRDTTTLGPLTVPADLPAQLNTFAGRAAFEQALEAGHPQPLQSGPAWIFPRRASDGGLIIHVLNLAYSSETDLMEPQRDLPISLPAELTKNLAAQATLHTYDAPDETAPVQATPGQPLLHVPLLRGWTVISIATTA